MNSGVRAQGSMSGSGFRVLEGFLVRAYITLNPTP